MDLEKFGIAQCLQFKPLALKIRLGNADLVYVDPH